METNSNTPKINSHSTPYLVFLALILGIGVGVLFSNSALPTYQNGNQLGTNTSAIPSDLDEEFFSEVSKVIEQNYIGDIPSERELTYGAIKGILGAIGNEYNSFLTPEEASDYLDSRNPNIEGIGVTLKFNGENTEVETVLTNYPAQKAGLKTGDIIAEVDGEDVTGQLPTAVANKVRGPSGTEVKVKVFRKDTTEGFFEYTVTRQKIELDNIDYRSVGDGLYKINIYQFLDKTTEDFNRKWDQIVNEVAAKPDLKGLVLDLRNNPGGYVYSVRYVLEEFLSNGQIVMSEQQKNKPKNDYTDARVGKFENVPVVVLVNEGSASASEILASSFQDNNRAKVVGKKTVGKGVEQQVMTLDDNSMLILVFQQWLTPSGRNINPENPVTPDFEVEFTEDDAKRAVDPQLEKAKEVLRNS
ncbi:S41 family peptidase [Candidatus Dojkabacteria bacterium]|nr:S41 family peptidase [Candidatus Dojkabacteria bacterium]